MKLQQLSGWDTFVRSTPLFNRFVDGTLIFGDCVMILATEGASDRMPLVEGWPYLVAAVIISWVAVSGARGDYSGKADDSDMLLLSVGFPVFLAVLNATVTWAAAILASLPLYAYLVSHFMVEASSVLVLNDEATQMAPQMEVSTALLVTMSCWRGIVAKLRYLP